MPALWFEFAAAWTVPPAQGLPYYGSPCAAWCDAEGWLPGEPFHPSEAGYTAEDAYVAPDGTRIAVYYPRNMFGGHRAAIAVYGDAPERTAQAVRARVALPEPREEAEFHRQRPANTAACAGAGGVWLVNSVRGELHWHGTGETESRRIAGGLYAPFAIAHGHGGIVVTSCDDPRRSRIARVDITTGEVTWLGVELDRPTQIAGIGDVVYAACADGIVCVDRAGAVERPQIDAPPPRWLGAGAGALTWIDASSRHVVRWDGRRAEILASGKDLIALDVDDTRAYALQSDGQVIACRPGRPPQHARFESDLEWYWPLAGLLRLGPLLVSADEGEAGPALSKLRCQVLAIGFPEMDAAPPALRAALVGDADSRSVMSDWLSQRGVRATADQIARILAAPSRQTATPAFESDRERPGELATSLVTADRQVGYHVVANHVVEVLYADAWY